MRPLRECGRKKDNMTNREFYTAIVNGKITDEVIKHAQEGIEKLDATAEKRRNTVSKKALENAPLIDKIVTEILTDEPKSASDVAEVLGVSVQKASSLLRTAVADHRAVATDVKIKGKGTQKGYTLFVESRYQEKVEE